MEHLLPYAETLTESGSDLLVEILLTAAGDRLSSFSISADDDCDIEVALRPSEQLKKSTREPTLDDHDFVENGPYKRSFRDKAVKLLREAKMQPEDKLLNVSLIFSGEH
ncbi:hypothetical protein DPMN_124927 [Dreissena polymorpha]|uniref:Uncharacterized protein n=1 Tax=Dreissena polymorpha TaxID=45954 RepID=A0A9D4JWN3_DREPO|nr:hypothetical protein DPMN_124927 [Dreissena polymorpha]